ncbi:unnamed protein product [Mytilus edulis]|uniref:Uncharacterized protein n=1 Tax=Mytilus edulis TaxID=6550 RepID=A0A8S3TE55_MYTED|nr:unnamed protein product [Mytilus edulis]
MDSKLKAVRAGHKSAVKRLLRKTEDDSNLDNEESAELLETLIQKQKIISALDEDIMNSLKEEDIEEEILNADEYKFFLNTKIRHLRKTFANKLCTDNDIPPHDHALPSHTFENINQHSSVPTSGSDTSIIDNKYSVTPGRDISPTINRTNNSTEVSSTETDLDTKSLVKDLRTEVTYASFTLVRGEKNIFISRIILRGIVPLQIKVIYNTIDLLDIQKLDTTFKLIQYFNETAFNELMTTSQEWLHNLSLAKASLEKFRKSSNFASQEINSPCDLIKDRCQNCKTSSKAKHGVFCSLIIPSTTAIHIVSPDTPHKSNSIMIVFGFSVPIVVMAILTVGICLRRRNILTRHTIGEGNNNEVPVHDLIKNTISGNVIMTGFSAIKSTKKTKKRGWSLPCRVIWEKQKNDLDIEQNIKIFGKFIEDTDTLKKRLRLKKRHRRGESF